MNAEVTPADIERIAQVWRALCAPGSVDPATLEVMPEVTAETCLRFVARRTRVVRRERDLDNDALVPRRHRDSIKSLVDRVHQHKFVASAAARLSHGRPMGLRNLLGKEEFVLRNALISPNRVNFVRFEADDQVIYLLQLVSTADAILIPSLSLLITSTAIHVGHVAQMLQHLCASETDRHFLQPGGDRRLNGFITSHGRPFHFFYDIAPGVWHARERLAPRSRFFYFPEQKYLSFAALLGKPINELTQSATSLNEDNRSKDQFCFVLGIRNQPTSREAVDAFDAALLARLEDFVPAETRARIDAFVSGRSVFWIGITGQKRTWVEQCEGLAEVVARLDADHPDAAFVFDGWTHPLDAPARSQSVREDEAVVADIVGRLPPGLRWMSSIGMRPAEKIYLAQRIRLFITNHTTGSIYVSRFARRPGVTHLNNQMGSKGHIHHDVVRVPKSAVEDLPRDKTRGLDFVDYHMSWQALYEIVAARLAGEPAAADDAPAP